MPSTGSILSQQSDKQMECQHAGTSTAGCHESASSEHSAAVADRPRRKSRLITTESDRLYSLDYQRTSSSSARTPPTTAFRLTHRPSFWMCALVVLLSTLALAESQDELPDLSKIPTPPTFVHEPNDDKLYFLLQHSGHTNEATGMTLKEREFRCQASAYPDVVYRWEKDGKPFDLTKQGDRIRSYPNEGTFSFSNLKEKDAGTYQCIASNGNGTAVDKPIHFISAWLQRFDVEEPKTADVGLGDSLVQHCDPPASDPPAHVYWIYKSGRGAKDSGNVDFSTINSTHISSDLNGNLYFHFVLETDQLADKYFTCTAENRQLDDYKFGNQFNINLLVGNGHRKKMTSIPPTELFVSEPRQTAVYGGTHRLDCFFAGFPLMDVRWYKDNVEIMGKEATKYRMPNFGRSVDILNVTDMDAGKYECRFENPKLNREMNLRVEAAPYFPQTPPQSVNASEGMDVEFECGAVGNPDPKFEFYKNGKKLVDYSPGYDVRQNKLVVKNVQKPKAGEEGDNAVYQCKATNKHGSIWVNFYLNILSFKPILLDHNPHIDVVAGQDVSLRCHFFASPLPMVTWIRPSSVGKNIKPTKELTDPGGVSTLALRDVKQHDSGEYRCHALNKEGETTGFIRLTVLETTRLVKKAKDATIVAGQPLRLECEAVTDPQLVATYQWFIDDKPISEARIESGHYRLNDDHSLEVREPRTEDSGRYTCVARTRLDYTDNTVTIVVKDVPEPPYATDVRCSSDSRTAEVDFSFSESLDIASPVEEIWVQYQIDDSADYNGWRTWEEPARGPWKYPQLNVDKSTKMRIVRIALKIRLRPYGKYKFRVIARNDVGDSAPSYYTGTDNICVTPAAVPEVSPSGVFAKGTTGDNLVIKWDPMPRDQWNGPEFGYIVRYRPEDEEEWTEDRVNDPTQTMYVVDNVPTYKPYQVQVQSVNSEGPSSTTPETVGGTSGEGVPEVRVSGFKLIEPALSGTAATFEWDAVDKDRLNGEFKGYKIVHWYDDTPPQEQTIRRLFKRSSTPVRKEAVFDPSATRGTVVGLRPNKQNFATISVFNNLHDGPASDPVTFRMPEGSPDPVEELNAFGLNATEVGLLWKPPREPNGDLKGYDINVCAVDEATGKVQEMTCFHDHVSDPDADHYRAKNLSPNQKYKITVQARSGAQEAGAPNSFFAKTLPYDVNQEFKPVNPNVTTDSIGRDHFSATWLPGNFNSTSRAPVGDTGFFKYREVGEDDDWKNAHPVVDGGFRATVKGLEPGTEYEVVSVAVHTMPDGSKMTAESAPVYVKTQGVPSCQSLSPSVNNSRGAMPWWWLIVIIAVIVLLIIILCLVCVISRHRGAKYIVTEKEKEQGREPMLGTDEKGFGEYHKDDDEKRSLTSKLDSEAGSMDEYGDDDQGRFTEDGSWIGDYVPGKKLIVSEDSAADENTKSKVSTFV